MDFFKSLAILLLLIFSVKFCIGEDYGNCSTDKSTLLRALYNFEDNLYQLDTAFASPGEGDHISRYINVNYQFADVNGNYTDNCTVKYIWAIGGFLLIHPPDIFQFTSLYFSTPANNEEKITLKLPYDCRDLTDYCICHHADDSRSKPLLVLTNQVI